MQSELTCSAISRDLNESLAGSVKPVDVFFLLETNATEYGGWTNKIVKTAAKSGSHAPLLHHLQSVPHSTVLFIRRPQTDEKNFYIAVTQQAQPKLYHAMLSDYDDILKLDLSTIAPDTVPQIDGNPMTPINELYAVCTNGKHDVCCSTHGVPVYHALVEHAGVDKVWQVSHIGGHRLAATMIAFPQGIYYGYLDAFNAEEIVTNHKSGYLVNYKYRGRGSYGAHSFDEMTHKAISAAEYHIRETAKKYAIDDLNVEEVESLDEKLLQVIFSDKAGNHYHVQVQTTLSEPFKTSCSEDPKPMPIHSIVAYQSIAIN